MREQLVWRWTGRGVDDKAAGNEVVQVATPPLFVRQLRRLCHPRDFEYRTHGVQVSSRRARLRQLNGRNAQCPYVCHNGATELRLIDDSRRQPVWKAYEVAPAAAPTLEGVVMACRGVYGEDCAAVGGEDVFGAEGARARARIGEERQRLHRLPQHSREGALRQRPLRARPLHRHRFPEHRLHFLAAAVAVHAEQGQKAGVAQRRYGGEAGQQLLLLLAVPAVHVQDHAPAHAQPSEGALL
mmetsp:Transcript_12631/g.50494  ORF Transcript_12631/g.50494 Transcript_12631/m.50494 type:complete len:241 (-) Transcript_12631:130-852(-)|eukprot:CAMPEP_0114609006 /NCGR_PEP_ID=MMETSP0168-20121206/2868_1 /TAXON_ID=95228 ORGANISM="Vannella sp., Strain DIVA3 517/6/12" /NCGR_SAMPLE_ID=MMETSP0168 /ASSEMBLY_ACC=CAM_ASM_000044 /LENGTH=240 /DNA_ID=CAMNT_0001819915 /DNA_START=71 /DNA_END=793 /DNA_ORIENTATION=-